MGTKYFWPKPIQHHLWEVRDSCAQRCAQARAGPRGEMYLFILLQSKPNMKILPTRTAVCCHNFLVQRPTKSRCQTIYVRNRHGKANFFPYKTTCFKHVLLSRGFTFIPFLTSPKKFRCCQQSVKWQLWHHMLQGEKCSYGFMQVK